MLQQVVIRTTRDEVRKYLQFTDRIPKTHIMQSSEEESQLYEEATDFVRELWKKQRGGRLFILPLMMLQRQISSSTECLRVALQNKMEEFPDESDEIMELLNKASTIKKDTKMKELEKIIETDPDEKYLIFTEFRNTQNYIFNTLKNNGLSIAKFNGDMSPRGRDSAVMEFKKDVNILVSTEAGGEGQNFQFCSNVINYDLPWNPMKVEQRVGRVHRIGQKNNVHIHNLAISGTIEDYILKMLFDKINLFKMTIGDLESLFEEEGLTSISRDAFESYMSATSKKELENKFSALGKKWIHKQEKIDEVKKEFHKDVWANVDLSSLEK
jgi:SNF2 family DNA or RNA helicase